MSQQQRSHSLTFEVLARRKSQALKFAQVRAQICDLNIELPRNIKVGEGERIVTCKHCKLWSMLDHLNQMNIKSKFRTQTPLDPQPPCAVETGQTWLGLMFLLMLLWYVFDAFLKGSVNSQQLRQVEWKVSSFSRSPALRLPCLAPWVWAWHFSVAPVASLTSSMSIYVIWGFPEMGVPWGTPKMIHVHGIWEDLWRFSIIKQPFWGSP